MIKTPYQTNYGTNTSTLSLDITTFISGATTNPTPNTSSSYARVQKIGNQVQINFKYVFATTGTTGAMSINLPYPINSNYPKPQGNAQIRYVGSSSGQVHICWFNENTASNINIVASTTFGGVPVAFTNLSPKSGLSTGDILTGVIFYETN
jgi:hypothetical protein